MKFIFLSLTLLMAHASISQKLYVWCPKDQLISPREGFLENQKISLILFDGRLLTKKSKVECTPDETTLSLANFIKSTYPSAKVNIVDSREYFKDPIDSAITIKIGIAAYHAAFGADVKVGIGSIGGNFSWGVLPEGKWNAITGYNVMIYDYRNGQQSKLTKEIAKTASKPNMGGYITAKNILNGTFMDANQELLFFIDNTFMK